AEADAAIAALCRERGIPEDFRPCLRLGWRGRGENAYADRRAELRRGAQTRIAAQVKRAQGGVKRHAPRQQTHIAADGLTSDEARAFLASMPQPEELLPALDALQLPNGEVIALAAPITAVTAGDSAVTASRHTCAYCGQAFTRNRRDAKYCQPACRV